MNSFTRLRLLSIGMMLMFFFCLESKATIWTISNNPASPAQFSNITTAADSASQGDTLLIAGSSSFYGRGTIEKPLTIVGPGYLDNPDKRAYCVIEILSDSVAVTGLYLQSLQFSLAGTYDSMIVRNCCISSLVFSPPKIAGIQFINNVIIRVSTGRDVSFLVFENNIIKALTPGAPINLSNCLFRNNNFTRNSPGVSYDLFGGHSSHIIENNIFYGTQISPQGCSNCTFNNNITFTQLQTDTLPYGNNVGAGNINSQDPLFVNYQDPAPFTPGIYSIADYRLQTGSSAINAGTDGTDMGITGGNYPFQPGDTPFLAAPEIELLQILPPTTIQQNGTLRFQFRANSRN